MNLTYEQALIYMKDCGFDISESTYKRDKKKLQKDKLKRLYAIAKIGLSAQHVDRIEDCETIKKLMWKNYHECNDPFKRVVILEKILNVQPYLSSYYETTQRVMEHDPNLKQEDNSVS